VSNFERAIVSYLSSTRHSSRISGDSQALHARRKALLRSGRPLQAAAIKRAEKRLAAECVETRDQG